MIYKILNDKDTYDSKSMNNIINNLKQNINQNRIFFYAVNKCALYGNCVCLSALNK